MRREAWIAGILALGLAGLAWHVTRGGARSGGESREGASDLPVVDRPLNLTSSHQCQECHPEVYGEWLGSQHQVSFTNPEVQRLSNDWENKDCLPCHLPRPIFETGLGQRVLERGTHHDEGVGCFACHQAGQAMLGPSSLSPAQEAAPCNPRQHGSIRSLEVCSYCHDQHKVHQDWMETRFAVPGPEFRDCNDCHMPRVLRADGREGRNHRFPAARDLAFLKTAATVTLERLGTDRLFVRVTNSGTGHAFPADERHRAADLELDLDGAAGRVRVRIDRYRNPYRTEFDLRNPLREPGSRWEHSIPAQPFGEVAVHAVREAAAFRPSRTVHYPESTQIPAGESRSYTLALPPGVRRVTLALRFRRQPFEPDERASLLYEETLDL